MVDVDPEFAKLMVVLAEGYPNQRLREGTIRFYYAQLRDVPPETLAAAMGKAAQTSEFFPTVAAIRKHVQPTEDDAALLAWAGLQQAASYIGAWAPMVVEDGYAAAALVATFGSWPQFCDADEITTTAKRTEFMAAYRQAARTGQRHTRVLMGLCHPDPHEHTWTGRLLASGAVKGQSEVIGGIGGGQELPAVRQARIEGHGEASEEAPRVTGGADGAGAGRRP